MFSLFVRQIFVLPSFVKSFCVIALLGLVGGCATVSPDVTQARLTMAQAIAAEPPGDYFIGRRYYKPNYHFWGYVRRPGQPWSAAQLVVLNEQRTLAPDRAERHFGFDNNYEYKLYGRFSGDKAYELVSNSFLPEFVLIGYELISTRPASIFPSQIRGGASGPYQIEKPE